MTSGSTRRIPASGTGQLRLVGPPADSDPSIASSNAALIAFPDARAHDRARSASASVRRLWRDLRTLDLTEVREAFEAVEYGLIFGAVDPAEDGYGDLFAIHAMALCLEDDTLNAVAAADQALRGGASGAFARLSGLVLRFCAWKAGAAPAASDTATIRALQATGALGPGSPNDRLADVLDLTLAAAVAFSRLQVSAAERLARCALHQTERAPMMGVWPAAMLGRILYALGRGREAEEVLRPRLALIRSVGSLDCVSDAYITLASTAAHVGDFATALAFLDEASELAEARDWPRLQAATLAERVRLCAPDGERRAALWLEQLQNLADRHRPRARCARSEIACHLSRARIHAFLKFRIGAPPGAALAHLRHDAWLAADLQASNWAKLAEAECLWASGQEDEALRHLVGLLRSVEATGLRQPLVDAGSRLAPMVERLLRQGDLEQGLLALAICLRDDLGRPPAGAPRRRSQANAGSDRLSPRERDVLKLIGEGRTNKMIAQAHGVGPETIKTHVKNIFLKLGVERRAEAVAKAERLGVL